MKTWTLPGLHLLSVNKHYKVFNHTWRCKLLKFVRCKAFVHITSLTTSRAICLYLIQLIAIRVHLPNFFHSLSPCITFPAIKIISSTPQTSTINRITTFIILWVSCFKPHKKAFSVSTVISNNLEEKYHCLRRLLKMTKRQVYPKFILLINILLKHVCYVPEQQTYLSDQIRCCHTYIH